MSDQRKLNVFIHCIVFHWASNIVFHLDVDLGLMIKFFTIVHDHVGRVCSFLKNAALHTWDVIG